LFERLPEDKPFIDLPYITVWAVITIEQVLIYSTRSVYPCAKIDNIHYEALTDLAWSGDKLVVCSQDGYCTLIDFDCGGKSFYD
jgi:hypothetical protein